MTVILSTIYKYYFLQPLRWSRWSVSGRRRTWPWSLWTDRRRWMRCASSWWPSWPLLSRSSTATTRLGASSSLAARGLSPLGPTSRRWLTRFDVRYNFKVLKEYTYWDGRKRNRCILIFSVHKFHTYLTKLWKKMCVRPNYFLPIIIYWPCKAQN